MTTDGRQQNRALPLGRIAGAIALVVAGWLAVVVALTFGSAPGKSMAIVGPPSQALAVIAKANGRAISPRLERLRSPSRAFRLDAQGLPGSPRLYAAGAVWLVLDAMN